MVVWICLNMFLYGKITDFYGGFKNRNSPISIVHFPASHAWWHRRVSNQHPIETEHILPGIPPPGADKGFVRWTDSGVRSETDGKRMGKALVSWECWLGKGWETENAYFQKPLFHGCNWRNCIFWAWNFAMAFLWKGRKTRPISYQDHGQFWSCMKNPGMRPFFAGWWLGIFAFFHSDGNFIIPTDELILFRGIGLNHPPVCDTSLETERRWPPGFGAVGSSSGGGTQTELEKIAIEARNWC